MLLQVLKSSGVIFEEFPDYFVGGKLRSGYICASVGFFTAAWPCMAIVVDQIADNRSSCTTVSVCYYRAFKLVIIPDFGLCGAAIGFDPESESIRCRK